MVQLNKLPASSVYPRGPKCSQKHYLFCMRALRTRLCHNTVQFEECIRDRSLIARYSYTYAHHTQTAKKIVMHIKRTNQGHWRLQKRQTNAYERESAHKCLCLRLETLIYSIWQVTACIVTTLTIYCDSWRSFYTEINTCLKEMFFITGLYH